jgi:hypothetical protein
VSADNDICPVCGITRDDELIPEAYEVIWDAVPELRAAQDAGEATYCPECERQLTYEGGEA